MVAVTRTPTPTRQSARLRERRARSKSPAPAKRGKSPAAKGKGTKGKKGKKLTVLAQYAKWQKAYPMALGCAQQGFIMAMANLTKQLIPCFTGGFAGCSVDSVEVLKAAVLGGIFMAPLLRFFYSFLDKKVKGIVAKTAIDQLVAAWFINTYAQFMLALLNGESFELSMKMVKLVMISWLWWVPLKVIMFKYIPVDFQVPFNACGSYGWNIIMFIFREK